MSFPALGSVVMPSGKPLFVTCLLHASHAHRTLPSSSKPTCEKITTKSKNTSWDTQHMSQKAQ